MGTFRVPKADAENPTKGGKGKEFPEGSWVGKIEGVRVRTISKGDKADFLLRDNGEFFAESAEIGSVQLGSATPTGEGQEDPGQQKMFDDNLYLSVDGVSWDDPDVNPGNMNWRYSATRNRLTNLAMAVGATEEDSDGVGPVSHFDELFRSTDEQTGGGLYGTSVAFETFHRKYKKRDKTDGCEVKVRKYEAAV